MEAVAPIASCVVPYHGQIVPYYPSSATELISAPFGIRIKKAFMMIVAATIVGGIIAAIGAGAEWNWLFWTGIGRYPFHGVR